MGVRVVGGGLATKRKEGRARRKSTSEDYGNDIRFFSLSSSCSSRARCLFPFAIVPSLSSSRREPSSFPFSLSLWPRGKHREKQNSGPSDDRFIHGSNKQQVAGMSPTRARSPPRHRRVLADGNVLRTSIRSLETVEKTPAFPRGYSGGRKGGPTGRRVDARAVHAAVFRFFRRPRDRTRGFTFSF